MLPRIFFLRQATVLAIALIMLMALSGTLKADAPQSLQHWKYQWGHTPFNLQGAPYWQSINFPANPPDRNGQEHVWFQAVLPEGNWNDPVLYITSINLIGQIYLDGEMIYQHGEFDTHGRGGFVGWPWHMVELPDNFSGKRLNIHAFSYYTSIGLWGEVQVMERIDVLKKIVHQSIQDLVVSSLVLMLALLATIFALIGPERRGFAAIALFAFASGLMLLAEAPARQLISDNALAWDTLRAGSYYMLPVALGMLLSHWLDGTPRRWLNWLWAVHLGYIVIALGLAQVRIIGLPMTFPIFDILLLITLPTMLLLALLRFGSLSREQRLLVLSFSFFAPLLLADMLVAHGFIAWRPVPLSYGTLVFSLANAAICLWHYRQIQRQLTTANETLEHQVASRTAELDRLVQELEDFSFKDALTGLYNRRHFDKAFSNHSRRVQQHPGTLALLMLDIDHFKQINDLYGHDAGDSVLIEIASQLSRHFSNPDMVCRFGGEEFIALLPTSSTSDAALRANAAMAAISQLTVFHHGKPLRRITLSCGIASYPEHTQDPGKLLRLADEALYQAKNSGRNRCVIWNEALASALAPAARQL